MYWIQCLRKKLKTSEEDNSFCVYAVFVHIREMYVDNTYQRHHSLVNTGVKGVVDGRYCETLIIYVVIEYVNCAKWITNKLVHGRVDDYINLFVTLTTNREKKVSRYKIKFMYYYYVFKQNVVIKTVQV